MAEIILTIENQQILVDEVGEPLSVEVSEEPVVVTVAGGVGPIGPQGPQGDTGPAGPPGVGGNTVTFSQLAAASTWTINHTWPGGFPSVTVVDSSGRTVVGDITYINDTQLTIQFTSPFSGKAYLN